MQPVSKYIKLSLIILIAILVPLSLLIVSKDYARIAESLFGAAIVIFVAYILYLKELKSREKEKIEDQFEILKNFMFDMNQNLGHIRGIAEKFYSNNIPHIKNRLAQLNNSDPFKLEVNTALQNVDLNKDYGISSYKRIHHFIDSLEQSCNNPSKNITNYILFLNFTFNLHSDLLHSVFNNFKQFKLSEFSELRPNLLKLRHIYDVYMTNISFLFNNKEYSFRPLEIVENKKKYVGSVLPTREYNQNYINSAICLYKYIFDFAEHTLDVLKELLNNKNMRQFFFKNKHVLNNLYELYSSRN